MRKVRPLFILFVFFLAVYWMTFTRVFEYRARLSAEGIRAAAPTLTPEAAMILAGEFKGLLADYLVIDAAAFIGGHTEATQEDWDAVSLLLRQSMALDPHFKQTYYLVQSALAWEAKRYDAAIELLKKSKDNRPWDWVPGFFIGFDYYFFLKDDLTASEYLMEASRVQDAPLLLNTLASRLAQRAGRTGSAIAFLRTMYEKTEDEEVRKILEVRIEALTGVLILEKGISLFESRFGRRPDNLDELVSGGVLKDIPQNPYNRPYTYEEGKIGF